MQENNFEKIRSSIVYVLDRFAMKREGRSLMKDAMQEATRIEEIVRIVDRFCRKDSHLRLLEIGLGSSMVTSSLRSIFNVKNLAITALEHPGLISLSNPAFLDHLQTTSVELKIGDVCQVPLPLISSAFDFVVFSETIEHLPPTLVPKIIEEISRLLKVGGVLIVSTPNLAAWQYRWKLMRGKKIFDPALPLEWAGGTYGHIRIYTAGEVADLMSRYGVESDYVRYMDFGLMNKSWLKRLFYRLAYAMFPKLSPEYIMYGVKRV